MYALLSIFLLVPLIFSHAFARLGEYFIIENGIGNFESVKVSIFFILLSIATIECIITLPNFLSKKTLLIGTSLLGFFGFEYLLFGSESLFGIGEKQHGSLFFGSLVWLWYLLSHVKQSYFPLFVRTILISGLIVSFIASIEYLFSYNIFTGSFDEITYSWGSGRATATLGNPNYVAGFLLIILPLAYHYWKKWKKITGFLLILLGIISTGSFIGIFLALAYILLEISSRFIGKKGKYIALITMIFGITLTIIILGGSEKWLSFISRFILMQEGILTTFHNASSIIIGNGPNGIIEYFEGVRSAKVEAYFPANMIIDSTHNLFIDLLLKFGWFMSIVFYVIIGKSWKSLSHTAHSMILLGALFFSLNVTILSAYILFVFALVWKKE